MSVFVHIYIYVHIYVRESERSRQRNSKEKQSWLTYRWAMSTYYRVLSHTWMRHVTHMNEACQHIKEFCHTHEWGMSHTLHTCTHVDESENERLIRMWDMTCPYVGHVGYDPSICGTNWHVTHIAHMYVHMWMSHRKSHSSTCGTWLINMWDMWDMARPNVGQIGISHILHTYTHVDESQNERLIHMWDMTYQYLGHDFSICGTCGTWPIHIWDKLAYQTYCTLTHM